MHENFSYCFLFCVSLFLVGQKSPIDEKSFSIKAWIPNLCRNFWLFTNSIPQHLEGLEALQRAYKLLSPTEELPCEKLQLPPSQILPMIALVNRKTDETLTPMKKEELESLQKIASSLPNRKLKTYGKWKEKDFLDAESEEVDLARGLFLALWGEGKENEQKILSYEALLDLMALQIKAKLPPLATSIEKIHAINRFIFFELGFRFPPHSIYAKNIDTYTFLPSVMDNRKGVCLGALFSISVWHKEWIFP